MALLCVQVQTAALALSGNSVFASLLPLTSFFPGDINFLRVLIEVVARHLHVRLTAATDAPRMPQHLLPERRELVGGRLPKDGYLLGDLEMRTIIESYAEDEAIFLAVSGGKGIYPRRCHMGRYVRRAWDEQGSRLGHVARPGCNRTMEGSVCSHLPYMICAVDISATAAGA